MRRLEPGKRVADEGVQCRASGPLSADLRRWGRGLGGEGLRGLIAWRIPELIESPGAAFRAVCFRGA
jgi:hypothetical protein